MERSRLLREPGALPACWPPKLPVSRRLTLRLLEPTAPELFAQLAATGGATDEEKAAAMGELLAIEAEADEETAALEAELRTQKQLVRDAPRLPSPDRRGGGSRELALAARA